MWKLRCQAKKKTRINNIKIPTIGLHNIRNATAAVAVAFSIGISNNLIRQGLKNFQGVQRRFNNIFNYEKSIFIDDYAHHPTEIKEVLNGVKEVYKKKEVICIFQPHRVSRLMNLRKEFSNSFKKADMVVLCPVYKAGENIKLSFKYENFAKDIINNSKINLILINNQFELSQFVKQNIFGEKIFIGMGAGSISNWMRMLETQIK